MSRQVILRVSTIALLLFSVSALSSAQDVPAPYGDVLKFLGRQGDFKDNVLKVNIPRNDVSVTVMNVKTPTPFGFGGWIAMTKGTGMDVMMGDLVLLQDEVNPVMSALLDNGLEATALHNHFFWDEPRMFYMHVHGHGAPMDLARKVKPALDRSAARPGSVRRAPATATPATPASGSIDTAALRRLSVLKASKPAPSTRSRLAGPISSSPRWARPSTRGWA